MNSTNSTTPSIWIVSDVEIYLVCINLLLVLPAHSYIIWLIIRGNGVASEIFTFNSSVCEIGTCLESLLYVIPSSQFSVVLILPWFLQGLGVTGSPLFQCMICVERYLAVVHPVTFLKFKSLRYKVICCTVVWILTLGSCFCCIFILMSSTIRAHAWWFFMQFLIFLSIELFCCLAVLRALKQSGPGERRKEKEENHLKRRAFHIILISTINMIIIYSPYTIAALFNILTEQNIPILWLLALICYVLSSFFRSVLYLHCVGKLSFTTFFNHKICFLLQ